MDYIIVQAGGKGTRLKQYTENKPKALIPVDNLPMLFHLFKKYPKKRFIIIADYKRDVLREYLSSFADVFYYIVDTDDNGTCAGIKNALKLIPAKKSFMLIWSDLILPDGFQLPDEYERDSVNPDNNYVGISKTFPCRWSFVKDKLIEEKSVESGVAGFFLFKNKDFLLGIPENGELVRWLSTEKLDFKEISLAGTKEFGLVEEYEKLSVSKCRPFNKLTVLGNEILKEPIDTKGIELAKLETAWYEKAIELGIDCCPKIYATRPLRMEYIQGNCVYEYSIKHDDKKIVLEKIISLLNKIHLSEKKCADRFSVKEAYYNKTMDRLSKVQDMIPFGREKEIIINDKKCRNVFFHKRELERAIDRLVENVEGFSFIHGDCTFSNIMLSENNPPVIIDPRGYFGYTKFFGDVRYDWAKLYYSLVGNYDQFNLRRFHLHIGDNKNVSIVINSNNWEDMEETFWELTNADKYEIQLIHSIIWLSLTTYAWQDYDSICGAFYTGLWYLEDIL